MLLNLRGEAQEHEDLGDPGAGDALLAGDGGLVGGLAGLEEGLPLDGLAKESSHRGAPLSFTGDLHPFSCSIQTKSQGRSLVTFR